MNVSNNFDLIVNNIVDRYNNYEITLETAHELCSRAYTEAEDEIIYELAQYVREGVFTDKEARNITEFMDNGYVESTNDIDDYLESTLFKFTEDDYYEADAAIANGKITDSERDKREKEFRKQVKRRNFKEKLKKVGKGTLVAGDIFSNTGCC